MTVNAVRRAMIVPFCFFSLVGAAADDRPDVVLILADDMGYGDVRCFCEHSKVATPGFDRVAAEGLRLTDSHSPASWCTPTRYSLLTGNYPFRSELKRDQGPVIGDHEITLPGYLKTLGYQTAMFGKWHLGFSGDEPNGDHFGGPVDRGFDRYYGIPRSLDIPPYYWIRDRTPVQRPTGSVAASSSEGWSPIQGAFWRAGKAAPDFDFTDVTPSIARAAEEFIRSQQSRDERAPYFLYVPLPSPHTPWVPSQEYVGTSELPLYGDFVAQVDGVIAGLTKAIDAIGATDNTLVIITSDNGACWFEADDERTGHDASGGYRGMKGDAHEGGHRVPTIVKWPRRVPAGQASDALTCHADFFATIAGFLAAPVPDDASLDSFDMSGVWETGSDEGPRRVFVEEATRQFLSVRRGDWKLIPTLGSAGFSTPKFVKSGPGDPAGQLYDLAADPYETANVYDARPDVVAELTTILESVTASERTRPE